MPILTVIAGPNGAGKSFNSQLILSDRGIHSFDFDFEFNSRWKQYSYDPFVERGVREYVGELFLERKQEAIKKALNFSFETNYHYQDVQNTVQDFKSVEYFTELVFMFLRNTDKAIQRVKIAWHVAATALTKKLLLIDSIRGYCCLIALSRHMI